MKVLLKERPLYESVEFVDESFTDIVDSTEEDQVESELNSAKEELRKRIALRSIQSTIKDISLTLKQKYDKVPHFIKPSDVDIIEDCLDPIAEAIGIPINSYSLTIEPARRKTALIIMFEINLEYGGQEFYHKGRRFVDVTSWIIIKFFDCIGLDLDPEIIETTVYENFY